MGVDAFIVAGGAQAVGALAYGLPRAGIEPVDLIVGPGNAWVTAAKLEVFGEVGIDLPAGPSEVIVVADSTAEPSHVAVGPALPGRARAGLPGPARHVGRGICRGRGGGAGAAAGHVRPSVDPRTFAGELRGDRPRRPRAMPRWVSSTATPRSTSRCPWHDVEEAVARLRNAGSLFVGPWAPESAGDYASGANHVLPTGGLARSCGALATETYGKYVQVQRITPRGPGRHPRDGRHDRRGGRARRPQAAVEVRFEEAER